MFLQAGLEAFCFDAEFAGFVLAEEIQSQPVDSREVFRRVTDAIAALIFPEAHIPRPVQLVLDTPVPTHVTKHRLGTQPGQVADVVAAVNTYNSLTS